MVLGDSISNTSESRVRVPQPILLMVYTTVIDTSNRKLL